MGISTSLKYVREHINKTNKVINSVTKNVLGASYSLSDILAFTSLLVPVMNMLSGMIDDYGLNSKSLAFMLKGVVLSASVYGIKNIIKRIKNKFN